MGENQTYAAILVTSLKKKDQLLDGLMAETKRQEELLIDDKMDPSDFQKTIDNKEQLLENLNKVDDGFEKIYARVKKDLSVNRAAYKNEIEQMKKLIAQITEKSVALQAAEKRNYSRMEGFLSGKRKEIREYRMSNRTVTNYYRNMTNSHQDGQTYFLDEKK